MKAFMEVRRERKERERRVECIEGGRAIGR